MFAVAQGKVREVEVGRPIPMVGIYIRQHSGHVVYEGENEFHISDESLFSTKGAAEEELRHRRLIWRRP